MTALRCHRLLSRLALAVPLWSCGCSLVLISAQWPVFISDSRAQDIVIAMANGAAIRRMVPHILCTHVSACFGAS